MNPLAFCAKALVRVYQYGISPILPGTCRYTPSCSAYALQAIDRFGAFKGCKLALGRIFRCHPWGRSGYDPVPEENESRSSCCGSNHDKAE
ncbi:membrane protein insertion efficiency factor YidD [Terasakiella sp. A23]|uniref:membrane protein insertion efficiency factor YidD n=1 Tax=Terasakiella sp. FCG-A23 TaxID=3080561 RepID=UPI0029548F40|nr:membrane protein insertion efficiency factor YidD [Terasakiella sp. A23]MDV7339758.1 membrane protein insertion efficiency factor YidD [Terasakiella sp. A23]